MLPAQRNARGTVTRYNNAVHETGQRWHAADDEGDYRAPVGGVAGRVAIHAMEIIHVRHRHVAASDDKVTVRH